MKKKTKKKKRKRKKKKKKKKKKSKKKKKKEDDEEEEEENNKKSKYANSTGGELRLCLNPKDIKQIQDVSIINMQTVQVTSFACV